MRRLPAGATGPVGPTGPRAEGFLGRRGLSHTRLAFQEECPAGALYHLVLTAVFGAAATDPTAARVLVSLVSLALFAVFSGWSFHSARAVAAAYRRDLREREERVARDVMES